jgi:hypothetical protein
MLLYELLRRRITVNDNICNSSNISSNHNYHNTGSVATVSTPTSGPVVASGASSDDSADELELAQQAAITATAAAADADAITQNWPLASTVSVLSALSGESQSKTSADVAATSDDAVPGESPAFNGEVFPGVDSDDDDSNKDAGGRTVLRPGSKELSSTIELPPSASTSDSDNSAITASPASTSTTAAVAVSDGCDRSSNNNAVCSSGCITSTFDYTSTSISSISTGTTSGSNCSNCSSGSINSSNSSSELSLSVPLQLHGRLQRSAELCRCVHATCVMHGMSEERIAQQCNTVLLLQAEAENRDASLASVETILIEWLSSTDSPLMPRHHIRQPWLVAIENKQYTLHKTRQVQFYFKLYRHCLASAHLLSKRKGAVSHVHVLLF